MILRARGHTSRELVRHEFNSAIIGFTAKLHSPLGLIRDAFDLSEAGHRVPDFVAKVKSLTVARGPT